jgi:hypothetical protein
MQERKQAPHTNIAYSANGRFESEIGPSVLNFLGYAIASIYYHLSIPLQA